jgi:uncharacterized protein
MTPLLSLIFGVLVGFAMGLTGGGGGVIAIPLLVFGLSIAATEAVVVSLAAVGGTALVGVIPRLRRRQVEVGTGLWFALAGMLGAPLGSWTAGLLSESLLLLLFAALMSVVGWRMWQRADVTAAILSSAGEDESACRRTSDGQLIVTSRCAILLAGLGLMSGFLAGLFGVGGGFVIVPALVLFSGMTMPRAIGTSLLVIVLVSLSGVASHYLAGHRFLWVVIGWFLAGGALGMLAGSWLGGRVSSAGLQKVFALGIVLVAVLIAGKTLLA